MIKNKGIQLTALSLTAALLLSPLQTEAANVSIKDIVPSAGAGSLYTMAVPEEACMEAAREAEGSYWGYTHIGIANVESGNLNVRETPSMEGKLVGKMPRSSACEILNIKDGWAQMKSGEVSGFVSTEYLATGADAKRMAKDYVRTVAVVNADSLKVRDSASMDSAVLTQVPLGEELDVVAVLDGWVQVSIDGEDAFVSAEFVTVMEKLDTAITMSQLLYGQGVSDVRVDMVEFAKQYVGGRYVWGGTSLSKGVDCSGFTMAVYKKFGVSLSHSSRSQAGEGRKISADKLQPGDLIFYANSSGTINHVALYIGGGRVIHASSPKTGIKISKYNYRTPVKYVSVLND